MRCCIVLAVKGGAEDVDVSQGKTLKTQHVDGHATVKLVLMMVGRWLGKMVRQSFVGDFMLLVSLLNSASAFLHF